MKTTQQPQLPTLTDWTEPQTVRGCDLATVIAQARAAGYHAHQMKVLPEVIYELQFWKLPAAETGKHLREPPKTEARARTYGSPDSLQIPNKPFNLHENAQTNQR